MRNLIVVNAKNLNKGDINAPHYVIDMLWNQGIEILSRDNIESLVKFINDTAIYEETEDKRKVHEFSHELGYTKLVGFNTLFIFDKESKLSLFIERIDDTKFVFRSKNKEFSIYLRY